MSRFHGLLLFFLLLLDLAAEWEVSNVEDESIFPNPERGFYYFQDLAKPSGDWGDLRAKEGMTLVAGKVNLEGYREQKQLPKSYLESLQAGFQLARKSGLKVIVRANYGHKGAGGDYQTYQDPSKKIILGHIEQLAPVWEANKDVIALFEAGFVGPWGEWHSTTITKDPELQREVYFKIIAHTPKNRMVLLRYPELKRSIFQRRDSLTPAEAYQPTDLARTGHHNDCFLSSASDVGTYGRGESSRKEETEYLSQETRFTVYGGETCAVHTFNDAARTLVELDLLNASYLNSSYHPDVLQKWKAQGCYQEVAKLLGARFVLREADDERVVLENVGFASLYNERTAFWVLEKRDGEREIIAIKQDPREWKSGSKVAIPLPENLQKVTRIGLQLPDSAASLRMDARYSIRLANQGVWDSKSGVNWILKRKSE